MTSIISKISIIILSLMAFACSSAEDKPAEDKPAEDWLVVHTADEARVTNNTTIVMPVTRDVFAFTDRPYRKHAYMTGEKFASLWAEAGSDGFKADPPNAVLTWVDGEDVKEAELVITGASFDGDSITYTRKYSATIADGTLKSVSLFVDSSVSKGFPIPAGDPHDNGGDPGPRDPDWSWTGQEKAQIACIDKYTGAEVSRTEMAELCKRRFKIKPSRPERP
jgi:hypothetical protein